MFLFFNQFSNKNVCVGLPSLQSFTFMMNLSCLIFYVLVTPKCIRFQKERTQMKCCIKQHFIRVCTVCLEKHDLKAA